ncbi:MAG TPA: ATP-binding cassette domain-containing protein [Mariprofundaceae bacterium]|nr:ATP-binding cassette domain-containing protein [Mariprofundaceae bacterium]
MIRAERLSRAYGNRIAVRDLSFHVRRGEVMGLLGPNGAGKSTTMKMLTCFLPPSSGSATVGDIPLDDSLAVRRLIGYLPENAPSYRDLDVRSHLGFIGRMQGIPAATLADRIAEMSQLCGLTGMLNRRIDELSKGYRQRVGLAASMLHDPQCLILDEPTTGLDPNQIIEIRHLIRKLAEAKTVLLSSHVLPEVEAACDRMMIIDGGELKALGTSAELAAMASGGAVLHVRLKGKAEKTLERLRSELPEVQVDAVEAVESGGETVNAVLRHADTSVPLAETLFHAAVKEGAVLLEMRHEQTRLEDVFRRLTKGASA